MNTPCADHEFAAMCHENERQYACDRRQEWCRSHRAEALEVLRGIAWLRDEFDAAFDEELDEISEWMEIFRIDYKELRP